jgi:hypothetical protein
MILRMRLVVLTLTAIAGGVMGGSCEGPVDSQAEKRFRQSLGNTSITFYPTVTRSPNLGYDEVSQQSLAAHFTEARLATVALSPTRVEMPARPSHNQSKMWRESAEAFAAYVHANPPQTSYAAVAEFLFNRDDEPIGIHMYLADVNGVLAYGVEMNSHHEIFVRNRPKTLTDATRTLIEHLTIDLGRNGKAPER